MLFQKWQKINFCTRKKFKITKNTIFGLKKKIRIFGSFKLFFAIFENANNAFFALLKWHFFSNFRALCTTRYLAQIFQWCYIENTYYWNEILVLNLPYKIELELDVLYILWKPGVDRLQELLHFSDFPVLLSMSEYFSMICHSKMFQYCWHEWNLRKFRQIPKMNNTK